ncbi:NAD(P)H-dependent oxidoreductase [Mesorhizobium sp. RMAD-H1]|uniref:FMN-dependent NADH-azoreductase n=1 Tax=Mesorhizobium sp. RMAD-H1 TaxID=2587065 RepID=UPI001617320D|nr:NAD(P)H-dependent oxidoreductase [Mesorhizobium sp. RMAD-H1]MBB2974447.1 FMN-dependent NADH-azoreductase [Mesorhizobium sp. RMAD-H1]
MTHILYIEASPRKERSASIEIAQAALAAWQAADSSLTVDTLDLWSVELPELDQLALEAKYAGLAGIPLTEAQDAAWAQIRALAARFLAADTLVLAVPLWNFSIPYKLKQLIDVVSQKDILFTFDERGFGGLLHGRTALLICARGLDYAPSANTPAGTYDFQKPYIETWLRFIGISDIRAVVMEKTLFGPDVDQKARDSARAHAIAEVKQLRGAGNGGHVLEA